MLSLDDGGRHSSAATILPAPRHLQALVEHLWVEELVPARRASLRRIVPDHAPHLIWHRFGARAGSLTVVGARTHAHVVDVTRRTATVGARLRPGALRVLLKRAANAFTDRSVALTRAAALSPDLSAELESAPFRSLEHALGLLTSAVEQLAPRTVGDDASVVQLVRRLVESEAAPATIAALAAELRIPERTLRSRSVADLGMPPKRILRIRRLHRALALHLASPDEPWTNVAFGARYADQAHLIRDCRALLGVSPGTFIRGAGS